MAPIHTVSDYRRTVDQIKLLKNRMWMLAAQRGNLDPEVIRVSQEIDEYIVSVQLYWRQQQQDQTLIG